MTDANTIYQQCLDLITKSNSKDLQSHLTKAITTNPGYNINFVSGKESRSLLHVAALVGSVDCVQVLLSFRDVNLDLKDRLGTTPLHLATSSGVLGVVESLVSRGASLNALNSLGHKPVEYAKTGDVLEFVKGKMAVEDQSKTASSSISNAPTGFVPSSGSSSTVASVAGVTSQTGGASSSSSSSATTNNNNNNNNNNKQSTLAQRELKDLKSIIGAIESDLPDSPKILKAFASEMTTSYTLFMQRTKESLRQILEEKFVVTHKLRLIEHAAGIAGADATTWVDQIQYLNDELDRKQNDLTQYKNQLKKQQAHYQSNEAKYHDYIDYLQRYYNLGVAQYINQLDDLKKKLVETNKDYLQEKSELEKLKVENGMLKAAKGGLKVEFASIEEKLKQILDTEIDNLRTENATLKMKTESMQLELIAKDKSADQLMQEFDSLREMKVVDLNEELEKLKAEFLKQDAKDEEDKFVVFGVEVNAGFKVIKAAHSDMLLNRLVDRALFNDETFIRAFLLTFHSFITAEQLFTRIANKMDEVNKVMKLLAEQKAQKDSKNGTTANASATTPPSTVAAVSAALVGSKSPEAYTVRVWGQYQSRLCSVLKIWIDEFWEDFWDNPTLLNKLNTYLLPMIDVNPLYKDLFGMVAMKMDPASKKTDVKALSMDRPSKDDKQPMFRKRGSVVDPKTTHWSDPKMVAQQLTLIEYELYSRIRPREFLDLAWMKESKRTKAPNICRMTDWSNHVIKWLISEIVSIRDLKSRAARMDNIIQMCKYLEELNNFNGMKEVVAALESSAIHRLRKTRDALAPASLKMLENFQAQTSSELNFKLLRAKIRETAPPYIPFPGVVQSDIVFLDSCGKNITANGMINFQKFVKTTGFVQELLGAQKTEYTFETNKDVQDYVRNFEAMDDDRAYEASLICEPRENKN